MGQNSYVSTNHGDKFVERLASRFALNLDENWSTRECRLHILKLILDNTIYDNLSPFEIEYNGGSSSGEYIPLVNRRPSVIYPLPSIIVNDSVDMLFDDDHFPTVMCDHENTTQFLQYITTSSNLRMTMLEAAYRGSIGSTCIYMKILNGNFHFDVLDTTHLTPTFDPHDPNKLVHLKEVTKSDGYTLSSYGYDIPKDDLPKFFFVEREWTETEENYYLPYLVSKTKDHKRIKDPLRSYVHDFGFIPAVWIKNLQKCHYIDGDCTFFKIIDIYFEINKQLSQSGRGLTYNADPTFVIKNPKSISNQQMIKNLKALQLQEDGEAYFVEMSKDATEAVLEYVRVLREFGLEGVQGNRTSPEKLHAAQSGNAMKMMYISLIRLASKLRLTYGDGLTRIYCMCLEVALSKKYEINLEDDVPQPDSNCYRHLKLMWPDWFPPTPKDDKDEADTLNVLRKSGLISQETAITKIAEAYKITDIKEEMGKIEAEFPADIDAENTDSYNKDSPNEKSDDGSSSS